MTDNWNQDIEKIIQALHTILYFKNNYPSTTEGQRIIQEALKVLKGDVAVSCAPTLRSRSTPPSATRKSRQRPTLF